MSQDPASGALGFQGVVAVTGSASDAAVMLYLERADAVSLSPVEPVWKAGQGWVAARDLKPGDYVRVPGGRAKIVSAEPGPVSPALNVVLADVGTLFVGERGMLVHDNSIVHPPSQPFDRVPDLASSCEPPGCAVSESTPTARQDRM